MTGQVQAPETLIKQRKDAAKKAESKIAAIKAKKRTTRTNRKVIFKRAEQYIKEYRDKEKAEVTYKRQAKRAGNFYIPEEAKLAFVIRTKGINNIPPKPRKILQLLRLLQINNGVFVRLTKATKQMLQLVNPYVAFGEPNLKSVRELIYKRGFGKVHGQRIPISENAVIQQALGKFGIICIEDLVHEIFTVGPNFKQANTFLWPFKLSSPNGGWTGKKSRHYNDNGSFGDREDKINNLIRQMN
ncbi:60S ribosomal protein L7 [Zancudomyces culisetae]|uniref:60S ribosomal protein L7 n=1 Tax=Zancudomyces culisetae TaxID=1213189 RepID=A0A1R1PCU0_ZANCU|nr:60S ribosomal protein L7 [Zancudomyces culisetae]|eukprot:OMH78739.1 60S ribosomal protein L7 [Zancudomyces culisetae]